MLLLQLLFACATPAGDLTPGPGGGAPLVPEPPAVSLTAPPAVDPLQGEDVAITIASEAGAGLVLEVLDPSGAVVVTGESEGETYETIWDPAGAATGLYTLRATATSRGLVSVAERPIALVRPGFVAAYADDDDGTSALREPLYWGATKVLQDVALPFSSLAALDVDYLPGALSFPPVTDDLYFRPDTDAEPLGYRWDSRPILTLDVGDVSVLGDPSLDLVDIDVSVPGWTVVAGTPLAVGTPVVLQRDEPLRDSVGVVDEELLLTFTTTDAAGTTWTLGEQALPARFLALLGPSGFDRQGAVYRPWVAVVDPALRAIDGTPPEANLVADALVSYIYFDLGLEYDTVAGASAYSSYVGFDWDEPHFFLTDFLRRTSGNVINCSDASNILGAYANMVGAELDHIVILENYDLNFIKAIGHDDYTSCPFGPGGCGFSYHAVASIDGGWTVWDATLALDGDDNPGQSPSTELLVQTIPGDEYLDRLVRSGSAQYDFQAEETLE